MFASYLSCELKSTVSIDEDGYIWIFGKNTDGMLGKKKINKIYNPSKIPNLKNIKQISCGEGFTVCCDENGKVIILGNTRMGYIKPSLRYKPTKLNIPPIEKVSSGRYFTVCIAKDSTLWSFGDNEKGQLGTGNKFRNYYPVQIPKLNDISFVECGDDFTYCKTNSGEIYSWGSGRRGKLSHGNSLDLCSPKLCKNMPLNIISIKCGVDHALFLSTDGLLYACGSNKHGRLGIGEKYVHSKVPRLVEEIPLMQKITCGFWHSLCIDDENNLWVFGYNGYGQLGLGDTKDRYKPTLNESLNNIIDISYGAHHTFVKTVNNEVFGFGKNDRNQLGISTTNINQLVPQQVLENIDIWAKYKSKSKQKSARK